MTNEALPLTLQMDIHDLCKTTLEGIFVVRIHSNEKFKTNKCTNLSLGTT